MHGQSGRGPGLPGLLLTSSQPPAPDIPGAARTRPQGICSKMITQHDVEGECPAMPGPPPLPPQFPQRSHGGIAILNSCLWENRRRAVGTFCRLGYGHPAHQMSGPARSSVVTLSPAFGKEFLVDGSALGLPHLRPAAKGSCVPDGSSSGLSPSLCCLGKRFNSVRSWMPVLTGCYGLNCVTLKFIFSFPNPQYLQT